MGMMMDKSGIAEDLMTDLAKIIWSYERRVGNISSFYWSIISGFKQELLVLQLFC